MTASKIFLYFCLSFVGGIFLNSIIPISQVLMLGFLILGILLISVLWKYKKLAVFGFCVLFLVLGIWQHQKALLKIENSPIRNFIGREISLIGIIEKEPDIKEKSIKLQIKIEKIDDLEIKFGRVLVTASRYPEYEYGDKLRIQGELNQAEIFEDFNYREYLAKDEILAVMYFPDIEIVEQEKGNFIKKILISFKDKLEESLNKVISRPQSAILEAFLFGEEENISDELKEKLNLTGTRHITAVSGMNLTILSVILLNFLLTLGLWRNQAFYFSIVILIFYILMIGAPASVVRAGIMAILFLTAQHFGRYSTGSRAVVIAATFMLAQNPLLLKLDVGFQLSFLGVMGLVYLQPFLLNLFKKIPNFLQLRYNLAATLAAQFFTFPILIYNFGQISLISPFINILILPLIPLITILGFIVAFIGIFWQALAQIFSWSAWLLLTYVVEVVEYYSKISWATIVLENVHWIFVIISYLVLAGFLFWLNRRQQPKFLNY